MRKVELPDRIAHGFLEVTGLHAMGPSVVRCYQFEDFHTGFTLFGPEQASVYVQMYGLPDGEQKLEEDLEFQVEGANGASLRGGMC